MPDIKSVTIEVINLGNAILRKYAVEYFSGVCRTSDIPPNTVEKFIKESRKEYSMVKYTFKDESKGNS